MTKHLLAILLIIFSFSSQASNLINDERVTEQKNCFSWPFTDYDSWRSVMEKKFKRKISSEEKLKQTLSRFDSRFGKEKFDLYKANLSCSTFEYLVDGNVVKGYIIKPIVSSGKLPVLIYNRGGNGNFGGVVFGAMMNNLFPIANEGFVIIGSQYRGTFNSDSIVQDEFGGSDINDVIALMDFIPSIEGADEQRIGMYGASRGGMQTHLAVKKATNIKAIATISGQSDLLKGLTYRPEMENVYLHRIPNYEQNKVTELNKRSVLNWVNELSPSIPILLIHGDNDKRVSVKHSMDLADALSTNQIPHKLVIYPEDDHFLNKNKETAEKELVNWFKDYL
ncbi:S9 family peptidase [Shewanella sp. MBTL60-112-B1]|uniref:alpha/beta hydrolase family protein n=1 Tax=Shewanella sp. MBTL60-112-B1 TaxID=2815916 RepID=UPI001BC116EC|nr:prolyl oligopeptidase family serine peptidase [Shewanella sp. MBTL60-112-B1]GIU16978.1 peptidase [Shewanella sp. MBTL60-112-B1]